MLSRVQQTLRKLRGDTSGNATILVAIGMPVLLGSSGIAVDFAQWYMWKRELQYAVDQAAIAGAWAKAEPDAAAEYSKRAGQEFTANLSMLTSMATTPSIALADYGTGTQNSVTVSSTASSSLPFTQMLIGKPVTVKASAQATFEAATNFTVCMLAYDTTASAAFDFGGNVTGTVTCGAGALSVSSTAMKKNGSSTASLGNVVSSGGVDSGFLNNGSIYQNVGNLSDPFEVITPPQDSTPRTYSCPTSSSSTTTSTTWSGTITTYTTNSYTYWQGKDQDGTLTQVTYSGGKSDGTTTSTLTNQEVPENTQNGDSTTPVQTHNGWTSDKWSIPGSGGEKIFEKLVSSSYKTYTNVQAPANGSSSTTTSDTIAVMYPGTYSSIAIDCDTYFSPGVYTLTGDLDFGQNHAVSGSDVMFVLQNAGKIHINSTSNLNMTGITASTLENTYGMSAEHAAKMAAMLIFDPNSTESFTANGGANIDVDGIFYMPNREMTFNGNSQVNGNCLMVAAKTLKFTGTNDISSFCIPTGATAFDIGGTTVQVRLVG